MKLMCVFAQRRSQGTLVGHSARRGASQRQQVRPFPLSILADLDIATISFDAGSPAVGSPGRRRGWRRRRSATPMAGRRRDRDLAAGLGAERCAGPASPHAAPRPPVTTLRSRRRKQSRWRGCGVEVTTFRSRQRDHGGEVGRFAQGTAQAIGHRGMPRRQSRI